MKILRSTVLYMAMALGANGAIAADLEALSALREGDMRKLVFYDAPRAPSAVPFENEDGSQGQLSDYKGKVTVVNLWATWCAPCRKEMPGLAELQAEMDGSDIQVVTLATGPVEQTTPVITKFFDKIGVDNLPKHRDLQNGVGKDMGIFGLPVTIILDKDGNEIAKMLGDAEWNSEHAKKLLTAIAEADAS